MLSILKLQNFKSGYSCITQCKLSSLIVPNKITNKCCRLDIKGDCILLTFLVLAHLIHNGDQ